jgi:RNA 2',3'-cyclic 3'-phosphodiesterase
MMAKLRLFVALELPPSMVAELERVKSKLRPRINVPLKWVSSKGSHLTLKFLGYVEENRVPSIEEAMKVAAASAGPLSLCAGSVGSFGGRRPRVVWMGLEGDISELIKLQISLDKALGRLGLEAESRPYHPHLTLARVPERLTREEYEQVNDALAEMTPPRGERVEFNELSLMQSTLKRDGAVYERLHSTPLGGPGGR